MTTYINLPLSGASAYWGNAVPTAASLPLTGNILGEAILVMDVATIVYWDGASWVDVSPTPSGTANTFTGFDSLGNLNSIPGWSWNGSTYGASVSTTWDAASTQGTTHVFRNTYAPTTDTTNYWTLAQFEALVTTSDLGDPNTGSGGISVLQGSLAARADGGFGNANVLFLSSDFGNGTDPVAGYQLVGASFNPSFQANTTLQTLRGFSTSFNAPAGAIVNSYIGYSSSGTITDPMSGQYQGVYISDNLGDVAGTVSIFQGGGTTGNIGGYLGVSIGGNIGAVGSNIQGFSMNIQPDSNIGAVAFTDSSTYTANSASYFGVNLASTHTSVNGVFGFESQMDIPLSTAIVKVFDDGTNLTAGTDYNSASYTPTIGTLSGEYQGLNINPTVTSSGNAYGISVSMQNVTASGNNQAIRANGNISFDGGKFFQGSLIVTPTNTGGQPESINSMISSVSIPANSTTANADIIGLNTAQLLTIGANSTTTAGPFGLGMATLAFPTVLTIDTGASLDYMNAALFAVSLNAANTGGTVVNVHLARCTAIPQGGTQTITNLRGFFADLPFGNPGTNSWGVYTKDFPENFFEGAVKIGGTPGSTDKSTSGTPGLEVENYVLLKSTAGAAPKLSLTEAPGGSDFVVSLEAPSGLAADLPFILPNADGTTGQSVVTDGAGQFSFASRVVGPGAATDNALARYDGTTGDILLDSLVTVDDDGILTMGGTTGFFRPPTLTTTQRNALTAVDGAMIFNTTTSRFQGYFSGAWADLHGWGS